MNENDDNLKRAKQAADMVMLQNKAKDYQAQLQALQDKEYQGRYHGISIKMKGDFSLLDVTIDQGFYETAGKSQIENSFLVLFSNLKANIVADQNDLQQRFQNDIERMRRDAMNKNGLN